MAHEAYAQSGINYNELDPGKLTAQAAARSTAGNAWDAGIVEITESRGESAFVWLDKRSGTYRAQVTEGLGTKTLVADAMREEGGISRYDQVARDAVAMMVNDVITVGARPSVMTAYWAVGSSEWFNDRERAADLAAGWRDACNDADVVWGGGETPALPGMVLPGVIELAGNVSGEIMDKKHLSLPSNLQGNEDIIMLGSSGIHANGLTLARKVAALLPEGYHTPLGDGRSYGEALLTPTTLYARTVRTLLQAGVGIRYMANITGHGLRKVMRAPQDLTYTIHALQRPQTEFDLIQDTLTIDDTEMYGTFNMGAGYAIMLDSAHTNEALTLLDSQGMAAFYAGTVRPGDKQVVLEPNGVTFTGDSLNIR